jgi:pimeloyl-ACP methyl ester carboxylesterase
MRELSGDSGAGRVSSPAILVGHSYGESVITAAGTETALSASSTSTRRPRTPEAVSHGRDDGTAPVDCLAPRARGLLAIRAGRPLFA